MAPEPITRFPTDRSLRGNRAPEQYPTALVNLPWIDIHNHAQTLSFADREEFALSGCELMVMMAYGYHWAPYKPVHPEHVQYQWDDALSRIHPIKATHPFDVKLGVGIHTGARVQQPDRLLDVLPRYCEEPEVAAIGETGITPKQHGARWSLSEQKAVVRRQMTVAADYDLPVILHTPSPPNRGVPRGSWYEKDTELSQKPVISSDTPVLDSVKIDLSLREETRLPESNLVFSHADPSFAAFVLANTDCYVSYTLSYVRMQNRGIDDIIAMVEEYGSDRILLETDSANVLRSDPAVIKRSIFELFRSGISRADIRQIVYENQCKLLNA